ncbi:hypothetical protein FS837_011447 [Tulasnella sp. UAMH 9824]|nr:hypothetical protein FS837_011447 [Tulasnella sp. UAMH 9824]
MVAVNDRSLVMSFAGEQRLPNAARNTRNGSDANHDRVMAIWSLPLEFEDLARCLAFDEATGIAVVGMASGRVLISDAGSAVLPSIPSDTDDDSEQDWINFEKEFSRKRSHDPPYPESKKWRGRANNPALDEPTKLSGLVPPVEIIPGWISDVESYYPFANHPDYYRSIPWLIRHAAGIPFRSRCILVSSEDIIWETGRNSAIIEVEVEFGAGGKLLNLVWREPGDGYLLYKFRPEVTRDNLLDYLLKDSPTMNVCEEKYWPLDFISTAQLELWDLRRAGYRS